MRKTDYEKMGFVFNGDEREENIDPNKEVVIILDGREVMENIVDFDIDENWVEIREIVQTQHKPNHSAARKMWIIDKSGKEEEVWMYYSTTRLFGSITILTISNFLKLQNSPKNKFWSRISEVI
jgi:hypothetical protein